MESIEIWRTLMQGMLDTIKATKQDYPPQIERKIVLEGELLPIIIEHPGWQPHYYVARLESQGFDLRDSVKGALRRIGLYSFRQQKPWAETIISATEKLKNLVNNTGEIGSSEQSLKEISSFLMRPQQASNRRRTGGARRKAFLIWLCRSLANDFPQLEQFSVLLEEVKQVSFRDTKVIVLKLLRELARCLDLDIQFQDWDTASILEEGVEKSKLSDMHDSLSDYLEWLDALVEIEREDFEKQKQVVPDLTAKSFFSQLNSVLSGRILNLLDTTALYIQDPKHQSGVESFDPRVKELMPLVKELRSFFSSLGLERWKEVGEQFTIGLDEVDSYEYYGSPFTAEEKVKQVQVTAPGWKYKELDIVSRPEVRELKKEA